MAISHNTSDGASGDRMQTVHTLLTRILRLRTSGTDLPSTTKSPGSALHIAAGALDVSLVQTLLQSGLDARSGSGAVNASDDEPIHTALRAYARTPDSASRVVSLLTRAGALDVSRKPFATGAFPPRVAVVADGAEDAVAVMLDAERERGRADELRRAVDKDGLPKLCCETGRIVPLLALLEEGWDARTPDEHGATLVHHACNAPHLPESRVRAVVQVLIDYGNADLSLRDSFGRTVLQIARRRWMTSVCDLLTPVWS